MTNNNIVNGVKVNEFQDKAGLMKGKPEVAKSKFRVSGKWVNGGHNRTQIKGFYAAGEERTHIKPFQLDADEPPLLLGEDKGPNPVELFLTGLAACVTTSLVYHAAVHGIKIESLESTIEGDLDLRGFMAVSKDVRPGYQNVRITLRVKSDAPKEKLQEFCNLSPVFDVVSHGTNVSLKVE